MPTSLAVWSASQTGSRYCTMAPPKRFGRESTIHTVACQYYGSTTKPKPYVLGKFSSSSAVEKEKQLGSDSTFPRGCLASEKKTGQATLFGVEQKNGTGCFVWGAGGRMPYAPTSDCRRGQAPAEGGQSPLLLFLCVLPKELGDSGLAHLALRHGQND